LRFELPFAHDGVAEVTVEEEKRKRKEGGVMYAQAKAKFVKGNFHDDESEGRSRGSHRRSPAHLARHGLSGYSFTSTEGN
jgi:hypothetical protein